MMTMNARGLQLNLLWSNTLRPLIGQALWFALLFKLLDLLLPYLFLLLITQAELKSAYQILPANVLILGDSHTAAALEPKLFAQQQLTARNYSRGGHYAEFNLDFYRLYRQRYAPPRAVILSAPYFMFANASDPVAMFSLLQGTALTNYYFGNLRLWLPNFYRYNALFQEIPLYLKRLFLGGNSLMTYGYMADSDSAFRSKELTQTVANTAAEPNPVQATGLDYVADDYSAMNPQNRPNLRSFRTLLEQLRADGVVVLLLETPEYVDTQAFVAGHTAFYTDFYTELRAEISTFPNVTFISQNEIKSINPADATLFSDGGYGNGNSHLSYTGSQRYTAEIVNRLRALPLCEKLPCP